MLRLLAIAFVWLGCAVAWMILGSTVVVRTNSVSDALDSEVHALWGPPARQLPPSGSYPTVETVKELVTTTNAAGVANQQTVEKQTRVEHPLEFDGSDIDVAFELTHRRKGLLWFPTYAVHFRGTYAFVNPTDHAQDGTLRLPLGTEGSSPVSFDDFQVTDEQGTPVRHTVDHGVATWTTRFEPHARHEYHVAYRSRGTSTWSYLLTAGNSEVRNFRMNMTTNFANVDFPAGSTSPSQHSVQNGHWRGEWRFKSLVSGAPIGVEMPKLLNPGPLASKVTFFAPVSLLFFFFVVAILALVRKRELHPMHYLLLGCAFFAFHLLFAYLVDHLAIGTSFAIASLVSIVLVVTYARLFVGWRFALVEMGLSQLIYLVLFSLTFFWEGYTGLAITIGAVVTLFLVMQITGRFDFRGLSAPKLSPVVPRG
ncbi:MAG TPA: inner membrane CreD family protein [Polyangiaceae bacterium]|nr:inner membrane CreD family protein [Polyangiaceae bacterium]